MASVTHPRGYDRAMADLVEMTVDSIRVHMPTGQHVVILKEKTADRYLPIWIGINEANAIALKITGITPERPITHDLLANLLSAVEVTVDRIVVTSLSNEVFYARILANVDGRRLEIELASVRRHRCRGAGRSGDLRRRRGPRQGRRPPRKRQGWSAD